MTREEIMTLGMEEVEARKAEVLAELNAASETAALDAFDEETKAIEERLAQLRAEIETRKADMAVVASGSGDTIEKVEERKTMTNMEIRNTKEYIDAYANYVKTGRDAECRALLTETVSGTVPVPQLIDNIVRTAWESDAILSRVRKTYFRGNLKVAFELTADGAVVHTEGTSAPSEEALTLGIVTMVPANVKKWIRISDEAIAMGGEAFLNYIYKELTYRIIKKLAALVIADITGASTSNSSTAVGVPKANLAPGIATIVEALGNLSEEAANPVIIMNRATEAIFFTAYAANAFAVDPFRGLPVLYNDSLPAYSTASTNDVYAIVGDLSGAQVNYPEGEGVIVKYDDLTEAEADMVKIVGRQYAAHAVTGPGYFCNLTKPAAPQT